ATSYAVEDSQGRYEGHTYVTSLALPERVSLAGGEISIYQSAKWPDLQLGVYRVSLLDTASGASHPLARTRVNVEPVPAPDEKTVKGDASTKDTGSTKSEGDAAKPDARDANRWKLVARTDYVDIYENA